MYTDEEKYNALKKVRDAHVRRLAEVEAILVKNSTWQEYMRLKVKMTTLSVMMEAYAREDMGK